MHVDDIDHTSEVTTTFTLIEHPVGTTIKPLIANSDAEGDLVFTIEAGKKTADALRAKAWGVLNSLTPQALRVKDPKRIAAARKATETKQKAKGQDPLPAEEAPGDPEPAEPDAKPDPAVPDGV